MVMEDQHSSRLLGNTLIVDPNANLHEYPFIDHVYVSDDQAQLTLGDLHGNALKLIYVLIRQQILQMSESDYKTLVEIYNKATEILQKTDLELFNQILNQSTIFHRPLLRLLGDTLCDRGSNDYFTLKVFEKLRSDPHPVPIEIIFSNHDAEFVLDMEILATFMPKRFNEDMFAMSTRNLRMLINNKLVEKKEIKKLYEKYFQPLLKLISCTIDEERKNITIYSHAPIGLAVIKSLAGNFFIDDIGKTVLSIMSATQQINDIFSSFVKTNHVNDLLDDMALNAGYFVTEINGKVKTRINPLQYPIEFCLWNRDYENLERVKSLQGYTITYVHGHDLDDPDDDHVFCLDNYFGKGNNLYQGLYHVLYSHEKIPTLINNQKKLSDKPLNSSSDHSPPNNTASIENTLQQGLEEVWCSFFLM